MRINHHRKVAFLLLACFCCLFCGSRLPHESGAKSLLSKSTVTKPTEPNRKATPADPIEKALDAMATFDFVDTPLKDVVSQIAADHAIPIKLDRVAIEDAGFDDELKMTGRGNGQPLRVALKLLSMDVNFVATIKHNTLLITTQEAITNNPENYLKTELYDITDLQGFDTDELIATIQDTIDPQSWMETNGGPATIRALHSEKKIVLVISHTSDHLFTTVQFLEKLRAIENSN